MSNVTNEGMFRPGPGATERSGTTGQPSGMSGQQPGVAGQAGRMGASGQLGGTDAAGQAGGSGAESVKQRSQHELDAARGAASEAVGTVKRQASELGHAVSQEASKVGSEAKRSATEAAQRLRSEGTAMLARQKNAAAEELAHLRDALQAASSKLDEHDDRRIADFAQVAADRLDMIAEYLRQQDLSRLSSDLSAAARRRPAMFYGGLFAIGLAASRFLKASSHHSHGPSQARAGSMNSNINRGF